MKKRRSISRGKSNRLFKATANKTHKFNMQSATSRVMRGGIRL